ncbi:Na+/H+ antiporter subunit E [Aliidiomarina minuta]|nr:Na+/H+ antiporter subunit E [Aliidiomarina minuta]
MRRPSKGSRLLTLLLLSSAGWWLLTEGASHGWMVGVPAVLATTALAFRLQNNQAPALRWHYLPVFVWFFISRSVIAGLDVARRTLKPQMDLNPGIISYPSQLPDGTPRLLFAGVISLLPGTLCAEFDGDWVVLHVLDLNDNISEDSLQVERHIARLFDAPVPSASKEMKFE